MKIVAGVISVGTLIGMCFAVHFYLDNTYAAAEYAQAIEKRLDNKIAEDKIDRVQQRIWQLEDRAENSGRKNTDSEKEEIRQLKEEKERLKKQLK